MKENLSKTDREALNVLIETYWIAIKRFAKNTAKFGLYTIVLIIAASIVFATKTEHATVIRTVGFCVMVYNITKYLKLTVRASIDTIQAMREVMVLENRRDS